MNNALRSLSASSEMSVGSLDMGGESSQISFIPKHTSILANLFPMHFGGFVEGPIHTYSHSSGISITGGRLLTIAQIRDPIVLLDPGRNGEAATGLVPRHTRNPSATPARYAAEPQSGSAGR